MAVFVSRNESSDRLLEITDEVGTAVPYIAATFIVVLVVVGVSMRSAGLVLLTALGLEVSSKSV